MASTSVAAYLSVFTPVTSVTARTTATATRPDATEAEPKLLAKAASHKMTRNDATYLPSTSTPANPRHAAAAGNQRNHWRSHREPLSRAQIAKYEHCQADNIFQLDEED